MRAQSLSVCIPNEGCDKNCPYCVSKITGYEKGNYSLMMSNLPKVRTLAKTALVSSVLFTSKGECFVNYNKVLLFIKEFRDYWTEIQTNGLWLSKNLDRIPELQQTGLNVVAVSVDDLGDIEQSSTMKSNLFDTIRACGMVSRITFNITDKLHMKDKGPKDLSFRDLIYVCKSLGVHQMTLRNIVTPNYTAAGAKVYDYDGIAVSYSDYCIQDYNDGDDIRSLIFQEDGHVYTSWNSKASILF
jgi:hypothetical protein